MISKEIKVGLLAIVGVLIAYFGFKYLTGNSLFNKGNVYYSVYQNVEGLHTGSKVVINGFPVGKVKKLTIMTGNSNYLLAQYVVMDESLEIPKNTIAQVLSTDIFGSKAINLLIGNSADLAFSGDTLQSVEAISMFAEAESKIKPYEEKFERILNNVDTLLANVKTTITTLNSMLVEEKVKIGELTENAVSITQNLEDNNQKISNTLTNLSNLSDSLSQTDVKKILDNANKAVEDMAQAMAKINNGTGTMGKLMNDSSLYVNLNKSAADLDILLKDMQENPRRYVHFSLWHGKDKNMDSDEKKSESDK